MTKEELIALSDLNREDNVKYISSEAQGIAIALDSDIYTPTLCKLERAYICGRRKSENRIDELEKQNAKLKEIITKMNNVITETFSKLTKAKEFLNEFMRISKAIDEDFDHDYSELIGETEIFLKEVEK